jgi:hypothetical protein
METRANREQREAKDEKTMKKVAPLTLAEAQALRAEGSPFVVAYGMGVDSTAMLIGLRNEGIRPDAILFADTGAEKRATYAYLPIMNDWLRSVGFPEVTVVRYETTSRSSADPRTGEPYQDLEGQCLATRQFPSIAFRQNHSCSIKWKQVPQDRYLKAFGPCVDAWDRGLPVIKAIGYDCGEKRGSYADSASEGRYVFAYSLRWWGWDREGCQAAIAAEGLPVPPKSSCFFCPAMKAWELEELAETDPDLFKRALELEAQAKVENGGKVRLEGLWACMKPTKDAPASWAEFAREKGLLEKMEAAADEAIEVAETVAVEGGTTTTASIGGRQVTAGAVLAACREADLQGVDAFLDRHGYGRARSWVLRANGRSYPSKAIVGVAAGLKASDFFGGVQGAVRVLEALGFEVRHADGTRADRKLDCLRRMLRADGLDVLEPDWPRLPVFPTAYFASGTNRPLQIRALGKAGVDVGVAVPELSPAAEAELLELEGSDVQVFVDSGAFSEVAWNGEGFDVVRPIDWDRVLETYARLAALGSSLWVVAPDRVGDQAETLARLTRYAGAVQALISRGVRVLVPIQKGELSQAAFAAEVDAILGTGWIPALPCKKAATTAEEAEAFVAARRPRHVHLLGLGIRSRGLRRYLEGFEKTSVSLDSCWIAANSGRSPRPRRLTRANDAAKTVLERTGASVSSVELGLYSCFAR